MGKLDLSKIHFSYLRYQQKIKWKMENKFKKQLFIFNYGKKAANDLISLQGDREAFLEQSYTILNEEFKDFINSYRIKFESLDYTTEQEIKNSNDSTFYVWVCWMQGEDEMPEVVKLCIESIKKNMPNKAKVVLITAKNIEEYVSFPESIVKKVRKGTITLTHFSDLLRFELLRKYGGLWIDSTCYVSSKIPESLIDRPIYTIQVPQRLDNSVNDYYGRVTSFIIGGNNAGKLFFDFCIEFFYEYHRRYNVLIDWHLINIVYAIAYRNFDIVRKMIDDIGANNVNVQELNNHANDDAVEYKSLLFNPDQIIHKMNWRKTYLDKTVDNNDTVFSLMKKLVNEQ